MNRKVALMLGAGVGAAVAFTAVDYGQSPKGRMGRKCKSCGKMYRRTSRVASTGFCSNGELIPRYLAPCMRLDRMTR